MQGAARRLIVNCDDFGMYPAVNTAVVRAMEDGIAGSCSLMVPCPGAEQAMQLLRRRPHLPFGIHLTLVRDHVRNGWGPVSPPATVPSLLDDAGRLFTTDRVADLLARARPDHLEREFRAQIDAVADAGLTPTHLDWHCLADGGRDDVFDLTVALADEYGLAVRAWLDRGRRALRERGLPTIEHDFLDSFRLDVDGKPARYAQLLHDLPAGLSEWAVHPGLDTAEARVADPGWRVRSSDHAFLTSPAAHDLLRQEGIEVVDHRALRRPH
jgi:predicted glycoside hydrolase/deacetylase ChbG (UPF0249 family)